MKRIISTIVLSAAISLSINGQVFYSEAESGDYKGLVLVRDSTASNGQYLRMSDSGFASWSFDVETAGWYQLAIGYKTTGASKVEFIKINESKRAYGFSYSVDWKEFNEPVYIGTGKCIITIEPDWGFIDLDYLRIDTVSLVPTLKPLRNSYYLSFPRDLSYKINRYGYDIKSITAGNTGLNYKLNEYSFQEDAVTLSVPSNELSKLIPGKYDLKFNFGTDKVITSELFVSAQTDPYDITIIAPYVEHGSAVIIVLPDGKTMLVDCAKNWVRDSILIPILQTNGITELDYFILTHYHEDHDSGDKGAKIMEMLKVKQFYDYNSFVSGDTFSIDGVDFKILNSFADGKDENTSSLAFKMTYKGFVYNHGGDTYAVNQRKMLERFPTDTGADVFYANHHFHGSIDIDYLREMDPSIVIIQAQEAIYARGAYTDDYKTGVEQFLFKNSKNYLEDLPTLEVGTVVVRVNSGNDWTYETYTGPVDKIPYINK